MAQHWQDWAALPSREGRSHPWPVHHYWELCGVPDSDCKEPGCGTGWPAVFRTSLCCRDVSCSCRFILHNIRRIHPFLTQEEAQVLVQTLVVWLLAGVPACAIRPQQLILNAAAQPCTLLLPIALLLPHYEGGPATTQQSHGCLLPWLHKELPTDIRKAETQTDYTHRL